MTDIFRKTYVAMAALLAMAVGYIHGVDNYSSSFEMNKDCCYPTPDCCAPQDDCCGCSKIFISGDFLYWRAFEGGLAFCESSESLDLINPLGGVDSFFRAKRKDPRFEWSPGFRIGLGYQFADSCLDIAVYWTDFHSKTDKNHSKHKTHINDHHFRWKLDFDVIDVVVGRAFNFESSFTMRPYAGVRGAYIHQTANGFRSNILLLTLEGTHNKSKFTGVGPLAGLEANYSLGCGFGLYANFAISGLWGNFRVRHEEFHTFLNGAEFDHLRERLEACQLVIDAGVGISWRKCFWDNKQFVITLGAEQHRYFNQNRIGSYGDLCLAGGVLSAGVEF